MAQYYYITFNGVTSQVDCGSDPSLDNLHSDVFTVDGWIRPTGVPEEYCFIVSKVVWDNVGWCIFFENDGAVNFLAAYTDQKCEAHPNEVVSLNTWTHFAAVFNLGGDDNAYIALDGVWCTYHVQNAAIGAVVSDAAKNLLIGVGYDPTDPYYFAGDIAWLRISNNIRYTPGVNFTPPAWCIPPAVDANTVELWRMDEGAGLAVSAAVNAANNGAGTALAWAQCFPPATHVINDILFATRSVGYISLVDGSGNPEVWRTIDGGHSWHILPERGGALGSDITTVGVLASRDSNHILVGGDTAIVALEG